MLHIDLQKDGLMLNGVFMPYIDPEIFIKILGEPRKSVFKKNKKISRSVLIWDELGFLINLPTQEKENFSLEFRILVDEDLEKNAKFNYFDFNPTGFFTGTFTLNGKNILKTLTKKEITNIYYNLEKKWKQWEISFDLNDALVEKIKPFVLDNDTTDQVLQLIENEENPFIGFYFYYLPPKKANPKYQLRKATDDDLIFDNFNFKLAIIEALMYEQNLLTPEFDVYDFCKQYTKREINPDDYYFKVIPEVKAWFEALPIPKTLAEKVTTLYLDGGNSIFAQLIPQWDGEDDTFNIQEISEREFSQFPHLKTINGTALLMSQNAQTFLKNKGVLFLI